MEKLLVKYKKKRVSWKLSIPKDTLKLAELIDDILVPLFIIEGFELVAFCLGDEKNLVQGNELRLEKLYEDRICSISIFFDKYNDARFQISMIKNESTGNKKIIDSAHLVSKCGEYFHFWGRPWWIPSFMWSKDSVKNAVEEIVKYTPQIMDYFNYDRRGEKISKKVKFASR